MGCVTFNVLNSTLAKLQSPCYRLWIGLKVTLNGTDQNPVSSLVKISNQHTASIGWEGNLKTICSDIHSFMDKELLTLEDL